MGRKQETQVILICCVLLLGGAHLACSGHDETESDAQVPIFESQRLARQKYEQGVGIFREDEGNVANLRSALELFEEAIALDSTLVEAHVGVGGIYRSGVHHGWFEDEPILEKAKASFERAIALDPTHMPSYSGLSRVESFRDVEEMLRIGERARGAGGPPHETRMMRAWTYFLAGFPDLTLTLIDNLSPKDSVPPSDPERQFLLAISRTWAGQHEAAIRAGNKFMEVFGEDADMHLRMATSYHCLGDPEAARTHYERSLELFGNSSNLEASIYAGICYEDLGLAQEAHRVWREASIMLENRLALVQNNRRMRFLLDVYGVLLGHVSEPTPNAGPFTEPSLGLLVAALARRGKVEAAVRVIDRMQSGVVVVRSLAPALGFPDVESPPYQEALRRLEQREARLREFYGPL